MLDLGFHSLCKFDPDDFAASATCFSRDCLRSFGFAPDRRNMSPLKAGLPSCSFLICSERQPIQFDPTTIQSPCPSSDMSSNKPTNDSLSAPTDKVPARLISSLSLGTYEVPPSYLDNCAICLGEKSSPIILSCGHSFCSLCIRPILVKTIISRCPMCRGMNRRQYDIFTWKPLDNQNNGTQ